ncbi:hypothetical protein HZS_5043 [Henneguya salminicola]|nr:hypothetical protein HZS_5043 [Henneguya salminicola]
MQIIITMPFEIIKARFCKDSNNLTIETVAKMHRCFEAPKSCSWEKNTITFDASPTDFSLEKILTMLNNMLKQPKKIKIFDQELRKVKDRNFTPRKQIAELRTTI